MDDGGMSSRHAYLSWIFTGVCKAPLLIAIGALRGCGQNVQGERQQAQCCYGNQAKHYVHRCWTSPRSAIVVDTTKLTATKKGDAISVEQPI